MKGNFINVELLVFSFALAAVLPNAYAQKTITYTYNSDGQVSSVDGGRQDVIDVTSITYYSGFDFDSGNIATVTNALGHTSTFDSYTRRGQPQKIVDENGVDTRLAYHPRGWLSSTTIKDPGGDRNKDVKTSYVYTNTGLLSRITLPNGSSISYEYDEAKNIVAAIDSQGSRIEFGLDAAGNNISQTIKNSSGVATKMSTAGYDELNRLIMRVSASGNSTVYRYDTNNNLVEEVNPKGGQTSFARNAFNEVITITDALDGVTLLSMGKGGVLGVTDARDLHTSYSYNELGRVAAQSSPDTGVSAFLYDEAGNITQRATANGVVVDFSYDELNRLKATTYPASPSEDVIYEYDSTVGGNYGVGRLTRIVDESGQTDFVYDYRGNLISKKYTVESELYEIGYQYDLANVLSGITYPSGRAITYLRNGAGRVSSITTRMVGESSDQLVVADVTYLPFGPIASYTYANGLNQSFVYDLDYRISDVEVKETQSIFDLNYSYDLNSNITSITDEISPEYSRSFGYDKLDRLGAATGGFGTLDYSYDAVGNRTARSSTASGITTAETYSYDVTSNQLNSVVTDNGTSQSSRTFDYDLAGNLIHEAHSDGSGLDLGFNDANRYSSLDKNGLPVAGYIYNALGQRVTRVASLNQNVISEHYHYDETGQRLAATNSSGALQQEYIYLEGILVAMITTDNAGGDTSAPAGVEDTSTVAEGALIKINVAANDTDAESALDLSSVQIVSQPTNGTVMVKVDGSVDYQHDGSDTSSDTFTYTIADAAGNRSAAVAVSITVTPVDNTAPVASIDAATVPEGALIKIDIATNDSDTESALDLSSVQIAGQPTNGTVMVNVDGSVDYQHDGSDTNSDAFTYTIADTAANRSAEAAVVVTVTPVDNTAPVASIDAATVAEGALINIDIATNDSDTESAMDLSSVQIAGQPTNGTVAVNVDGSVDYLHDGSDTSSDAFTYTIADAAGNRTEPISVNVSVTAVDDVAPTAVADIATVTEGALIKINVATNDSDVESALDLSSVQIAGQPINGTVMVNADGSVDYQHDGSDTSSDAFTYTIADAAGNRTAPISVNVSVTTADDPTADPESLAVTLSESEPVVEGTLMAINASAQGSTDNYEYRVWVKGSSSSPSAGAWLELQSWSTNSNMVWNTKGYFGKANKIKVLARIVGDPSSKISEVIRGFKVTNPVESVELVFNDSGPHVEGVVIGLTGVAQGGTGDYEYKFLVKGGANSPSVDTWLTLQGWSASNTANWDTTGYLGASNKAKVVARNRLYHDGKVRDLERKIGIVSP